MENNSDYKFKVAAPGAAPPPIFISSSTIKSLITHKSLIQHLQSSLPDLSATIQSPLRHTHQTSSSSSLLLMPSWFTAPSPPYTGVKIVTHYLDNSSLNLPGVHAVYVLFSSITGQLLATMDATELTLLRTAAVSALASLYLSKQNAETLSVIGAGALAPHLIKSHLKTRPGLKRVVVWNRTLEKAISLVDRLNEEEDVNGVCFEANGCLQEVVKMADIISCATNSETPLVKGEDFQIGAHLDLVGSFTAAMRECDDVAIERGRVFVDNAAATVEAGELVGKEDAIVGDLVRLIKGEITGRRDCEEITVFKSVGSAVVDLLSAQFTYESFVKSRDVNE